MPYLSKGKSRTSKSSRTITTFLNSRMEVGRNWYGFYHRINHDTEAEGYDIDNCGQIHKKCTFIPVNQKDNAEKLVEIYVKVIVSKHRVPKKIVSERGSVYTLAFWKQIHE